jgi:hypothetical protein
MVRSPRLGSLILLLSPLAQGTKFIVASIAAYLRHRSPLAPELVLEPKPLDVDRTGPTALRASGVMAVAALVAWALVSLLDVGQRSGNDNFHTAVPPNPASGAPGSYCDRTMKQASVSSTAQGGENSLKPPAGRAGARRRAREAGTQRGRAGPGRFASLASFPP